MAADTITTAGVCLLDEQVEELADVLNEAAAVLRESDGDLATRLLVWADTVQGDGDVDLEMLEAFQAEQGIDPQPDDEHGYDMES